MRQVSVASGVSSSMPNIAQCLGLIYYVWNRDYPSKKWMIQSGGNVSSYIQSLFEFLV
jgi:hypothetical protein